MNPLVSPSWLASRSADPKLRIFDASWYLPEAKRDARAEFAARHIPGAMFFAIDELSDESSPWPHMLAPPEKFGRAMGELGVGNDTTVVVYDAAGLYSSPRAWWMLRAMGHEQVRILDGGLPAWQAAGYPVTTARSVPAPATFQAKPNGALGRGFEQVMQAVTARTAQVIDARGEPRFHARQPEPRPGVRGGHMPGAINMPYTRFTNPDGTLKAAEALRELFAAHCVNLAGPVITSCGSGITAAIAMLALEVAGATDVALYDGSWAEWGARPDALIETD